MSWLIILTYCFVLKRILNDFRCFSQIFLIKFPQTIKHVCIVHCLIHIFQTSPVSESIMFNYISWILSEKYLKKNQYITFMFLTKIMFLSAKISCYEFSVFFPFVEETELSKKIFSISLFFSLCTFLVISFNERMQIYVQNINRWNFLFLISFFAQNAINFWNHCQTKNVIKRVKPQKKPTMYFSSK